MFGWFFLLGGMIHAQEIPDELQSSYDYAYSIGITTQSTIGDARMMDSLNRAEMAKMMVQFAENVLWKTATPKVDRDKFSDLNSSWGDLEEFAKKAYDHGMMWVGVTSFDPAATVDRKTFATVMSRAIWGDIYNTTKPDRYGNHLAALNAVSVMNDISNPHMMEIRGYVMLMMKRADQDFDDALDILEDILGENIYTGDVTTWTVETGTVETGTVETWVIETGITYVDGRDDFTVDWFFIKTWTDTSNNSGEWLWGSFPLEYSITNNTTWILAFGYANHISSWWEIDTYAIKNASWDYLTLVWYFDTYNGNDLSGSNNSFVVSYGTMDCSDADMTWENNEEWAILNTWESCTITRTIYLTTLTGSYTFELTPNNKDLLSNIFDIPLQ